MKVFSYINILAASAGRIKAQPEFGYLRTTFLNGSYMMIVAYAAAVLIGVSLGLLGGGGSILTVPVLVYLVGLPPVTATAYSLFIVGSSSLVGAFSYSRKGLMDLRTALPFALPSVLAVYATRRYLIPAMPEVLFSVAGFEVTKDLLVMLLFAVLMLLASFAMIRKRKLQSEDSPSSSPWRLGVQGAFTGLLTGAVGAGGGFLIVPALVLLAHIPVRTAIGTSLLIIAANSLIGFLGDVQERAIDWPFLLVFTAIAVAGIFLGMFFSRYISADKLKPAFGWFVLVMGCYVLARELFM